MDAVDVAALFEQWGTNVLVTPSDHLHVGEDIDPSVCESFEPERLVRFTRNVLGLFPDKKEDASEWVYRAFADRFPAQTDPHIVTAGYLRSQLLKHLNRSQRRDAILHAGNVDDAWTLHAGLLQELAGLMARVDGSSFDLHRCVRSICESTKLTVQQARETGIGVVRSITATMTTEKLAVAVMNYMARHVDVDWQDAAAAYDYGRLKKTLPSRYLDVCVNLRSNVTRQRKKPAPRLSDAYFAFVREHHAKLDELFADLYQDEAAPTYNFVAMATFRRQYLLRVDDEVAELPEHVFMREAIVASGFRIDLVPSRFYILSRHYATHASPNMFNAGTPHQQLSSCFLIDMKEDSIDGIYETLWLVAKISKRGGGVGLNWQNIRNQGTEISTGGESNGLVAMLKSFDDTINYVSQGRNRRGSLAGFFECWNKEMQRLCEMRQPVGAESERCRDIFTGVVMNDVFFERVQSKGYFTLFCPTDTPDLMDLYGPAFTARYEEYEANYKEYNGVRLQAWDIVHMIAKSAQETGAPYILSKSNMNRSQHTGMFGEGSCIRTSNLCVEIMQHTGWTKDTNEYMTAVCTLATIKLDRFVVDCAEGEPHDSADDVPFIVPVRKKFDFEHLGRVVQVMTRNLDMVVTQTEYPSECTRRMNLACRPLGLGIQGMADTFIKLGLPYDSPEALELDGQIAACMYYHALTASWQMAKEQGVYPRWKHSPAFKEGKLQFDLAGKTEEAMAFAVRGKGVNGRVTVDQWADCRQKIKAHGLRNSLLMADPPTASTATILRSVEAGEPVYKYQYVRRLSNGYRIQIMHLLQQFLQRKGLWSTELQQLLIKDQGSLHRIPLTDAERAVFKTAFDMKMKDVADHYIVRQMFKDQSQSFNVFWAAPTVTKMVRLWRYGWKNGLKTLCYYIKRRPKVETKQFAGISDERARAIAARLAGTQEQKKADSYLIDDIGGGGGGDKEDEEEDGCLMCGS